MIAPATIDKIREEASCHDVIGGIVELKQKGKLSWGLSPFKQEKTPSFCVREDQNRWRCFATNQGGDIFSFFQIRDRMSFPESVRHVAQIAGIEIEEDHAQQSITNKKSSLRAIYRAATDFFYVKSDGMDFFGKRQITSQEVTKGFELGYAPDEWFALYSHLQSLQFSDELILESGLCFKSEKSGDMLDRFRARMIFPIHDPYGRPIAFGGRKQDSDQKQQGKYINSSESDIYKKSKVLYGLFQARDSIRDTGFAYLTEGYTDVLMIAQKGEANAVASCGTAFTEEQAKLLSRYTSKVVVVYDGDKAGVEATKKAIPILLSHDFIVQVIPLQEGQDPDKFLRQRGREEWDKLPRLDWLEWCISVSQPPENPAELASLTSTLLEVIEKVNYKLSKELYIEDLARRLGVNEGMLRGTSPISEVSSQALSLIERTETIVNKLADLFKISIPEDFEFKNKIPYLTYRDLSGKELTAKRHGAAGEIPTIKKHVQQVYIPEYIRSLAESDHKPLLPLLLVKDAITAWWLSRLGIPAVGISWRYGFLSKQGGKTLCQTLKQVIGIGFQDVIMVSEGDTFSLPFLPNSTTAQDNPYRNVDTTEIARDWVTLMIRLKESLPKQRAWMMWMEEKDNQPTQQQYWLDKFAEDRLAQNEKDKPLEISEFSEQLQRDIVASMRGTSKFLKAMCLTDYSRRDYEKLLHIDNPQTFYDHHGPEKLGIAFQFGRVIYEVDRDGGVNLREEAQDELPILEMGGMYWARTNEGLKKISNFKLNPVLKIRGQKPYVLAQLEDRYKIRHDVVLDSQLLLSADQFHLRVYGLADCFFHGNNQQLRHLQEMLFQRIPSAYLMDQLGHQKIKIADQNIEIYAFGNGLITYDGGFVAADNKGLARAHKQTFFLPADAEYEISSDRDAAYETHKKFSYVAGNSNFKEWINLMFKVHTPPGTHVGFSYALMSMYRDIIYDDAGKIPNCYLQGETGSGKSTLRESLSYLWGEVPTIMINGNPSTAAVGSLPLQASNCMVVMEEFNVFKMVQNRREDIIDVAKAVYDGKSRAVRQNAQSEFLKNKPVRATLLCCGQEAFYQYDEAVPNRFIVAEFEKRTFHKPSYNELRAIERGGISHILEELLLHRSLIKEKFNAARIYLENTLGDRVADIEVLDRLVQNWAITIAPLLILIKSGKIEYPWTMDEIVDHAEQSIRDHAKKSISLGVVGEFWAFIQSEFGHSLDDRLVFFYKEKKELRMRFREVYRRFIKYLNSSGDRTIQAPTEQNLKRKITDKNQIEAYVGESKTYMGFVRDAEGKLIYNQGEPGEQSRPVYDVKTCLRFDLEKLDIQISNIRYASQMPRTEDSEPLNGVVNIPTKPKTKELPF